MKKLVYEMLSKNWERRFPNLNETVEQKCNLDNLIQYKETWRLLLIWSLETSNFSCQNCPHILDTYPVPKGLIHAAHHEVPFFFVLPFSFFTQNQKLPL